MKKFLLLGLILGVLAGAGLSLAPQASAQVSGSLWKLVSNVLYPVNSTWGLAVPSLANNNCIGTDSSGIFIAGTCSGGGSSVGNWFTPHIGYNSTSTAIGFLAGLFTQGSTTIETLGSGTVNANNGLLYGTATSTPTVNAPITYSGTLGQFISGVSGAFGCTNASSGVTGCLTGTDWNTFNGKQATISTTWPITLSGATVGFNGLATSTQAVLGNLPYFSGVNTFANVATTSVTCSGNVSCTSFTAIGASPITINGASGTAASSTLLGDSNTFSGVLNKFSNTISVASLNGLIGGNSGSLYAVSTSSLNASITGSAGSVTNAVTFNNGGAGGASGSTFNGSGALTVSYNTIGAQVAGNYDTFSYPFPSGATSSPLSFTGLLTITNSTTSLASFTYASSTQYFGANLASCTGTNSLTWTGGVFGCTAIPQGTVTAVNGTANQITSSGGATPTLSLPNHVIFPLEFLATNGSTTNATSTNLSVTGSSTIATLFGAGLSGCNSTSNALTWSAGLFGCNTITGGTGSAYPFTPTINFGVTAQATTGIPWFQNGLQASSTSQFGQTVFSGPVTGGFFLSTTTLASKPVYAVGNDSTTGIGIGASTGGLNFYGSGNAHFQITSAGPGSTFAFGPSFSSSQGPELIDTNGSDSIPSLYFTGSGYGLWYDGSLEVSGGGNRLATFGGSSITFAQPFTVNTGKLSTLNGGFLSTASSTVNGQFAVSTSTQGCATFGVGGVLYSTGTACGTGGGGSVGNWFTPDSNFAALTNSTSTPVWFKSGLQASSTSEFDNANFTGSVGINTFAPAVALDVNGSIRAYQPGGTAIIKASDSTNSNYTQMYNTGTNGELESTNTFVLSAPSGVFVTGTNNPQLRVQFGSGSFHSGTFYDDDSNFFIGTNAGAIILQPTTNVQFPFASSTAQTLTTLYSTLASTTNLTINIPNCNTTSALTTNAAGVVACGAISGSGGSVGNWFTPTTYGNATSTTIGFNLGLLSIGSTTVNGVLHLPLSNGGLAVNGGAVYSTPTTTLSAGSNITLTPSGNNIQIAASGGSGQSPYSWVVAASGGDYTTIQAALTQCGAVGGGDIILTDPLYNQGGTGLTWRGSNCHIEGRGLGTTTINFTGATTYFKTNSAAGQYSNNSIDGITISGDGNASGVVFDLSDMSHFGLTHTTSDDVGTWIKINDTQNVSFYDDIEHNQATTIVAFGINASSTNPVNGNLIQDNFIGCGSNNCIGLNMNNANGNNFTSNYFEPDLSKTGVIDINIFDNKLATNNGVFNNQFNTNYLEGSGLTGSVGVKIATTVDVGGGIERNIFTNTTNENHVTDWSLVAAAIANNTYVNNYDSNFANPLTTFGVAAGVGTSTELANINNPPYAALAVSANTSLVTQEFVVANSTANRTDLIVNATGGVLLPNLVSQTCLGTSATGLIQTGTCSGGSAFPFTPTTDFAVNTSATSTPIWARLGLFASSTSVIGTTTFASNGFVGFGTSTPEAPITFAQTGGLLNPDFIIDGVNGLTGAEMELNRGSNTGTEEANIDFNTNSTEFWQLGMQNNSTNDFELWDGSDDPAFTVKTSTNAIGFGTTTPFGDFAINADFGDALPGNLIFNVASSTATATTTLFSISNVGNVVHRILNSFSITDIFGTQDVAINTASTTGSIFTVAATTSPSLVAPIKLFDVDQYGHLTASSTRATPAVSSCGTGSGTLSANANDVTGTVTTATAATACTITFSSAYATLPSVVVSGASLVGFPSVTAVSTSAFTIGISAAVTGDAITYIVITP